MKVEVKVRANAIALQKIKLGILSSDANNISNRKPEQG